MPFTLMKLPYATDALAPHISAETLQFHHGKHHKKYVDTLNQLVTEKGLSGKSLEEIIRTETGKVFNNAAQVWNHDFYWHSMSPDGGGEPTGAIKGAIERAFGDFASFKAKFEAEAAQHFGSGWAWLIDAGDGKLAIESTHDADNPLRHGRKALLTCDVWEHAYYIDYRNDRGKYLGSWWNLVNWEFASHNLESARR